MRPISAFIVGILIAGCGDTEPVEQQAPQTHTAVVDDGWESGVRVGMTEEEARAALGSRTIDTGTVFWGGSGARRIYFQVSETEQFWIEMSGGPNGRVTLISKKEPKQEWTRYDGDSITVEDGPTTNSTLQMNPPLAAPFEG